MTKPSLVKIEFSVHVSVLLSNCKQSITSLSLLVGTTAEELVRASSSSMLVILNNV